MGRYLRYLPSTVIAGAVFTIAACNPLPPPIVPNPPPVYPIPSVTPVEICQHTVVPGYRFLVDIPQRGLWAITWFDSIGNPHDTAPYWFEAGSKFRIETNSRFHVRWNPEAALSSPWHTVSADVTPVPSQIPCPDF